MYDFERLSDDVKIAVSSDHTFGTDAVILAHFAKIKRKFIILQPLYEKTRY